MGKGIARRDGRVMWSVSRAKLSGALGGPSGGGPNDLEAAALAVEPRLGAWRDRLADATGQTPQLAGSGSTWFVEGAYPGDGRVVTRTQRAT